MLDTANNTTAAEFPAFSPARYRNIATATVTLTLRRGRTLSVVAVSSSLGESVIEVEESGQFHDAKTTAYCTEPGEVPTWLVDALIAEDGPAIAAHCESKIPFGAEEDIAILVHRRADGHITYEDLFDAEVSS